MTNRHWHQVKSLLHRVLDLSTGSRDQFLESITGDDARLLDEVKALLSAHESSESLLDSPLGLDMLDTSAGIGDLTGRRIGTYRLTHRIGAGGMGVVYLGERDDGIVRHRAAIKLVSPLAIAEDAADRFLRERQLLAQIDHPNIAYFIDAGTTEDGLPYFIMEHVDGTPIGEYCDRHRLSIPERIDLFLQVADAVAFVHSRHGILHRDIKPANILVSDDGVAKLVDFGIAHTLSAGAGNNRRGTDALGSALTPLYASPEQLAGARLTDRSDVYSLGVVLYELLTGHHPVRAARPSSAGVLQSLVTRRPLPPSRMVRVVEHDAPGSRDGTTLTPERICRQRCGTPDDIARELSGPLEQIVLKAIRPNPRRRYAKVADLMEALRQYRAWRSRQVPSWGRFRFSRTWANNRGLVLAVCLAMTAGTLGWQLATLEHRTGRGLALGRLTSVTAGEVLASQASMSPSGDRVAYVAGIHGHTQLFVQTLPDGVPTAVASDLGGAHEHPTWHPSGRELVFEATVNGSRRLYRVGASGGVAVPVGTSDQALPPGAGDAAWSPSGTQLAYVREDGLYVYDVGTSTEERVVAKPLVVSPIWHPAGTSIVFSASDEAPEIVDITETTVRSSIWRVDLDTRQLRRLTDRAGRNESPVWLPDGNRLLFLSDMSGSTDLYEIDGGGSIADGIPAPVRHTVGLRARHLSVDQRGTLLAFSVRDEQRNVVSLRIPPAGETSFNDFESVAVGVPGGAGVAVSADGNYVFYDVYAGGERQIAKRSLLDGSARPFLSRRLDDLLPALGPEPDWLIFLSGLGSGFDLHAADVLGRSIVQLTQDGGLLPCYDGNAATPCMGDAPMREDGDWLASAQCASGEPGFFPVTRALSRSGTSSAWIVGDRVFLGRATGGPYPVDLADRQPLSVAFGSRDELLVAARTSEGLLEVWRLGPEEQLPRRVVAPHRDVHGHRTMVAAHGDRLFVRAETAKESIWVLELQ